MNDSHAHIALRGVVDSATAEALATRIRSAVRNGCTRLSIDCAADTVLASSAFLAFLLRARDLLHRDGGSLHLIGDQRSLNCFQLLGVESDPLPEGVAP